jgi:hypothetical protein
VPIVFVEAGDAGQRGVVFGRPDRAWQRNSRDVGPKYDATRRGRQDPRGSSMAARIVDGDREDG